MELVFYVPGSMNIVDLAIQHNDVTVSQVNHETHEQLASRYPGVTICSFDDAFHRIESAREIALKTEPIEITEDQFIEMLECLPPDDWTSNGDTESFKMIECTAGKYTGIYARIGERYFSFTDICTMKHDEIVAKISFTFKENENG